MPKCLGVIVFFKFCLDMGDISRLADIADPICIENYVNLIP